MTLVSFGRKFITNTVPVAGNEHFPPRFHTRNSRRFWRKFAVVSQQVNSMLLRICLNFNLISAEFP